MDENANDDLDENKVAANISDLKIEEMVKNTEADTIFMALNSDDARKLRPYMGSRLPIYGTSLIFPTKSDRLTLHDLEGVRFVDMPLVVENISQNEESPLNDQDTQKWIEPERFYALGIDAYRIITHILKEKTMSTIEGVTGTLVLSPKQIIDRQGIAVHLSNGRVKIIRLEDDN